MLIEIIEYAFGDSVLDFSSHAVWVRTDLIVEVRTSAGRVRKGEDELWSQRVLMLLEGDTKWRTVDLDFYDPRDLEDQRRAFDASEASARKLVAQINGGSK